ncbi:MAG: type II toxin-antitoxin system VapC family toxin [Pleurocapsa sp. SU_5_0]|nr:type II toxin-antitoxin system VapC family toxin [Pleurocapsa sp. SU_5_0]
MPDNEHIHTYTKKNKRSLKYIFKASTKFELEYGLTKKPGLRQAYAAQLDLLFQQIGCLDFDRDSAIVAAAVKHQLFIDGTPISIEDLMIGAIALHYDFTVVTSNTKHFKKIEGLVFEDWKS